MKKVVYALAVFLFISLFGNSFILAQSNIDISTMAELFPLTPEQLAAQHLQTSEVSLSNIQYHGDYKAIGLFEDNNNLIDLSTGIVLGSGDVIGAENGAVTHILSSSIADPDLTALVGGFSIHDITILEFDFVTTSNSISFNYVFGSTEYGSYVCGNYADPIAFFLSGPGIDGPFSNGGVNIAVVPGSQDIPINVNTINDGIADGNPANCLSMNPYWQESTIYYNAMPPGASIPGATVPLSTMTVNLQPDSVYHLKIAICDAGDSSFNSYLFIETSGFTPPTPEVVAIDTTICEGAAITIHGEVFSEAGVYTISVEDQSGNDSLLIDLTLDVVMPFVQDTPLSTCLGDTLYVNNQGYTENQLVTLTYTDQYGCDSIYNYTLEFAPIPIYTYGIPDSLCLADTLSLVWERNLSLYPLDAVSYERTDSLPLPDGTGASYQTEITIQDQPLGAVLTDVSIIQSICVNMEHSWMYDLDIQLTCPDGTQITLQNQEFISNEVFLGIPNESDDIGTPNPPAMGTGYTYCWTPDATNTWTEHAQIFDPQTLPEGNYASFEDLGNLVGCPLNGEWQIRITDYWGSDNGWLFSWGITLNNEQYNNSSEGIADRGWLGDNMGAFILNPDTLAIVFEEPGVREFTYFVTDSAGCYGEVQFPVNIVETFENFYYLELCHGEFYILDGQILTAPGIYQDTLSGESCDTINTYEIVALPPILTYLQETTCVEEEAGTYVQVFTAENGCDSTVTLELTYVPFSIDYEVMIVPDSCGLGVGGYLVSWEDGEIAMNGLMGGSYQVTIGDENGCIEYVDIDVPAIGTQAPEAGFVQNGPPAPEVSFMNFSIYAETYLWDFGDGSTSTEFEPVHIFPEYGVYEVCLTVSNSCGSDTYCQQVNVWRPYVIQVDSVVALPQSFVTVPVRFMTDDLLGGLRGDIAFDNPDIVSFDGLVPVSLNDAEISYSITQNPEVLHFEFTSPLIDGQPLSAGDTLFMVRLYVNGSVGEFSSVVIKNLMASYYLSGNVVPGGAIHRPGQVRIIGENSELSGYIFTSPIHNPALAPMSEVVVHVDVLEGLSFDTTFWTFPDGSYNPGPLTAGIYRVTPESNGNAQNGLATIDLIRLLQHTAEINPLTEPYDLIAADVTCDAFIDNEDLAELFGMVLTGNSSFANCPAWTFIPEGYPFPDPGNPFGHPTSVSVALEEGESFMNLNFYGIKKGDLTRDADPNNHTVVTQDSLIFLLNNGFANMGEIVELEFSPMEFEALLGFQFAVQLDPSVFQFLDITEVTLPGAASFGVAEPSPGTLRIIWFSPTGAGVTKPPLQPVFKMRLMTLQDAADWSQYVILDPEEMTPEAYEETFGPALPLTLRFDPYTSTKELGKNTIQLFQNQPNPFAEMTTIAFSLPRATRAQLIVHNQLGQVIWAEEKEYGAGLHSQMVQLPEAGLYYYTLRTNEGELTKKMICTRGK